MKMRIFLFLMLFPVIVNAQWNLLSFKAGVYTPYDLKTGAIYGIDYGTVLDNNISLMLSGDLYYKSIINENYLDNSERLGINIRTGQRLSEWIGWHLPITAKVRFEIPLEKSLLRPYAVAAIGYGVTHVSYTAFDSNNQDNEGNSFTYNGVVWQLGAGLLYRIGRNTDLLFEIIQNSAEFTEHEDFNRFTTLNSSGLIFRLGVSLEFLR
ncbi:MAG: outer membrane beta-barrel protein [Clostridiales bacterium]